MYIRNVQQKGRRKKKKQFPNAHFNLKHIALNLSMILRRYTKIYYMKPQQKELCLVAQKILQVSELNAPQN